MTFIHAIAKLNSDAYHVSVPRKVIDEVTELMREHDADDTELQDQIREQKLRAERAEKALADCEEDLGKAKGQIRLLELQLNQLRNR